ncbi:hypothetical protein DQ238_07595 [Geodermatophilus sp. TF02-6]|uniref:serine/threonine-protein kinase n=1 Tax=Geodermatophilus sp. TF02-6 TaxID=2250575 RepID=UPI000DE959CE|nr:serine/threonine-protein kinase [Geodermatophilus sp. TF02-6]RBY80895.1 hypothetical protein DQ238_07595 [Geodermatophilus sp. TF02-6]
MVEEPLGSEYRLLEELGRGAVGVVWRAVSHRGGPPLAAKLLHQHLAGEPEIRDHLLREEAVLRQLRHDSVVAVRDVVAERGRLALIMDLVDGPDLRRYLQDHGGTLRPAQACSIAAQVAAGLAAVHAHGVLHLDLKPENILVEPSAEGAHARITDFGIAVVLLDAGQRGTALGGTPGYTAPELTRGGRATTASDVFSLGVVLVEMLTGHRPEVSSRTDLPSQLPTTLRGVVRDCLAREPRRRPSLDLLRDALRTSEAAVAGMSGLHLSTGPASAEVTSIRPKNEDSEPTKRRRRLLVLGASIATVLATAGTGAGIAVLSGAWADDRPGRGSPAATSTAPELEPSSPASPGPSPSTEETQAPPPITDAAPSRPDRTSESVPPRPTTDTSPSQPSRTSEPTQPRSTNSSAPSTTTQSTAPSEAPQSTTSAPTANSTSTTPGESASSTSVPPSEVSTPATGQWVVAVTPYSKSSTDALPHASERASQLTAAGQPAEVLDTSKYPSLPSGSWLVYVGPYSSQRAAADRCLALTAVPNCYPAYLGTSRRPPEPVTPTVIAVLATFGTDGWARAEQQARRLTQEGITARVLLTDYYVPALSAGHWIVYAPGPFADADAATEYCRTPAVAAASSGCNARVLR